LGCFNIDFTYEERDFVKYWLSLSNFAKNRRRIYQMLWNWFVLLKFWFKNWERMVSKIYWMVWYCFMNNMALIFLILILFMLHIIVVL